jgi:Tol biopolymer transport system component
VWVHDLAAGTFRRLSKGPHEERWPLWSADGRSLWISSEEDGTRNLVSIDVEHGSRACLTTLVDDGVLFPTASSDGKVVVFRRLFDLWRFEPGTGKPPEPLTFTAPGDPTVEPTRREELVKASEATTSADGREVAFIAGGDVWVMDTELREPRRVTDTPEEERDPVFSPDLQALVFVSDAGGRTDLWKAACADCDRWWWQNGEFKLTRITDDAVAESEPRFTPDGSTLLYTRVPGDLWKVPWQGGTPERLVTGFHEPEYDVSPDGKWVAYVKPDDDYNDDVWILPLDLSRPPFNVSVHPDEERSPRWSPDGRLLAFTGRRWDQESDICYVWLRAEDDEKDARARRLEKAVEKMKGRKAKKPEPAKPSAPPAPADPAGGAPEKPAEPKEPAATEPKEPAATQ